MKLLEHLLRSGVSRTPVADARAWLDRIAALPFEDPFERAVVAGFEADRLGWAFVGGYESALARLLGSRGPTRMALAATESGGAHPRAIATVLAPSATGYTLHGEKTFATLASVADELLVVASVGASATDGRNRLRLARVPASAPGIRIADRPPTPFAPEIPHAIVTLTGVAIREADVLPGDGYQQYLKPFRTIEDIHVVAATLGHVIGEARTHDFARTLSEGALALVVALAEIARREPVDPVTHVALAGIFQATRRLLAEHDAEWAKASSETRARWQRDLGLLLVAEQARTKRTEAAWTALFAPGP